MKPPIFVRTLTEEEREQLEAGLRSSDVFMLRRYQILLTSVRGYHATTIGQNLGCDDENVRKVIKPFNAHGIFLIHVIRDLMLYLSSPILLTPPLRP